MFKQIRHDQATRTSLYCDGVMHIGITDPANAHSGVAHDLKLTRCECLVTEPKTAAEFEQL